MTYSCRICGTALEQFMSFGEMPIANGFLTPNEFKSEYFFELKPGFCESCFTYRPTFWRLVIRDRAHARTKSAEPPPVSFFGQTWLQEL